MATTFSSLPAELRLQIAAFVLEQPPNAGLIYEEDVRDDNTGIVDMFSDVVKVSGFHLDPRYSAADNLSILRVCRQFRNDFFDLAYQKTRFLLVENATELILRQPEGHLRNVRKLAIRCDSSTLAAWDHWPFNDERVHLDELCIALLPDERKYPVLVRVLRNLRDVESIRIMHHPLSTSVNRVDCNRLIGLILKEDHYQRYDAPNAPNLESTWWDWSCKGSTGDFIFVAQEPKPIMEEAEYMKFVKPKIDAAIENILGGPQ